MAQTIHCMEQPDIYLLDDDTLQQPIKRTKRHRDDSTSKQICGFPSCHVYQTYQKIQKHRLIHLNQILFGCSECKTTFVWAARFKKHAEKKHSDNPLTHLVIHPLTPESQERLRKMEKVAEEFDKKFYFNKIGQKKQKTIFQSNNLPEEQSTIDQNHYQQPQLIDTPELLHQEKVLDFTPLASLEEMEQWASSLPPLPSEQSEIMHTSSLTKLPAFSWEDFDYFWENSKGNKFLDETIVEQENIPMPPSPLL